MNRIGFYFLFFLGLTSCATAIKTATMPTAKKDKSDVVLRMPTQFQTVSAADATYDLKLLEEITNISSETFNIAGVMEVQMRFKKELDAMGFKTSFIANPTLDPNTKKPTFADMLVAEYSGKDPRFVSLVGHADTVFKELTKYSVSADGKKIMGSGVGDDKGGVIVGLRALKLFLAQGKPKFSIRVIITGNEEVGSTGMAPVLKKMSEDSYAVFGIEPSNLGNILVGRKGVRWYQVDVTGVEAHAGVAHEKGANACLDLALKLGKVAQLTDYNSGVTVNIGTMSGGKRANIVCGTATGVVDTRFRSLDQDTHLKQQLTELLSKPLVKTADGTNVSTQSKVVNDVAFVQPFDPSNLNEPYIELYKKTIQSLEGFIPNTVVSGGGADISHMSMPHLIMMDALGPYTEGSHTPTEFITVESMKTRPIALLQILQAL